MVVNNLCIYTKQLHDDSEINSGDHIIPLVKLRNFQNHMFRPYNITLLEALH
ncbi:hypothetical protein P9305_22730 [Lysinibacillus capsici]|uniref:hypothetical protein n=1 Tax=Lysinibacillus capsici TaxID=2115968 RepID=UPI002E206AB1|nr:hypothetical protein [Lysinibacillus capsici]